MNLILYEVVNLVIIQQITFIPDVPLTDPNQSLDSRFCGL